MKTTQVLIVVFIALLIIFLTKLCFRDGLAIEHFENSNKEEMELQLKNALGINQDVEKAETLDEFMSGGAFIGKFIKNFLIIIGICTTAASFSIVLISHQLFTNVSKTYREAHGYDSEEEEEGDRAR